MALNINYIRLEIYFIFANFLILYDYNFINALVGRNVKKVERGEYPYVISIATLYPNDTRPREKTHRCTAALIGPQDAVTALHCIANIELTGFHILVGSRNLREATPVYCLWWWSYDHWAQQHNIDRQFIRNDIAYIKINGNVPGVTTFATLTPYSPAELYGERVVTAAWGKNKKGKIDKKMRKGSLTIISNEECSQRLTEFAGYRLNVVIRRLCTIADPYILLQSGDSGGPLLKNNSIVAINSGTCPQVDKPWHPKQANLHFTIDYYRTFLLDVMHNTQTHFMVPP